MPQHSFDRRRTLLETAFLKEFLPKIADERKIYLETNGILYYNLEEIIDYLDIISMDYKIESATGHATKHDIHKKFINIAQQHRKNIFIKVVFNSKITDAEIKQICELAAETHIFVCLQPMMQDGHLVDDINNSVKIFNKFLQRYKNVRLIPQVHTLLGLK